MRCAGKHDRQRPSSCWRRCSTYDERSWSCSSFGASPVGEHVERVGVQAHSSAGLSPSDPSVLSSGPGLRVEQRADRLVEVLVAELGHLGQVLAEAQRVVEVGGGGQQVGVRPDGVTRFDALTRAQRAPQGGGVAQPAWTQLEPDQGRERLLGGTTGGPATADRLLHLGGGRHPLGCRLADHVVDPALDQGQRRLQPGQRGLLLGALLGLEQTALQRLLDRLGVASGRSSPSPARCRTCRSMTPRPKSSTEAIRCWRSHGTCANRRWWAASRRLR